MAFCLCTHRERKRGRKGRAGGEGEGKEGEGLWEESERGPRRAFLAFFCFFHLLYSLSIILSFTCLPCLFSVLSNSSSLFFKYFFSMSLFVYSSFFKFCFVLFVGNTVFSEGHVMFSHH